MDDREYTEIDKCAFCERMPKWVVSYQTDYDGALFDPQELWVLTCDDHKTTAFS